MKQGLLTLMFNGSKLNPKQQEYMQSLKFIHTTSLI